MRSAAPGVMRKRVKVSDRIDASHRLVRTDRSTGDRTERLFSVSPLKVTESVRAVFKLDHRLRGFPWMGRNFALAVERLALGSLPRGIWQSAHLIGYQDGVSRRVR